MRKNAQKTEFPMCRKLYGIPGILISKDICGTISSFVVDLFINAVGDLTHFRNQVSTSKS